MTYFAAQEMLLMLLSVSIVYSPLEVCSKILSEHLKNLLGPRLMTNYSVFERP